MIIIFLAFEESSCFCDFSWRKCSPCKPTNSSLLLENCCLNTTPDLGLSAAVGLSPLFSPRKFLSMLHWPLSLGFTFSRPKFSSVFPAWPERRQPQGSDSFGDALDKKQTAEGQAFWSRPSSIHRGCRQGEGSVWQLGVAHMCQSMSVLCELQSDPWGNSAIPIDDAFWNEMLSSYRLNRELLSLSAFWLWDYHVWILNTWSKTCRPFVLAQGRIFRQLNNGNLPACSLHHLWKSCYRTDLRRGW